MIIDEIPLIKTALIHILRSCLELQEEYMENAKLKNEKDKNEIYIFRKFTKRI